MPRKSFLITAVVAIGLLYIISQTSDTISLAWRTALYKSTNIMGPYQAPLLCNGRKEDLVPQGYIVYLHHGCSLEEHKQAVGEGADLGSAIEHIFPESKHLGLWYTAELNDRALAAVRSDLVVDMVECDYYAHLIAPASFEEPSPREVRMARLF